MKHFAICIELAISFQASTHKEDTDTPFGPTFVATPSGEQGHHPYPRPCFQTVFLISTCKTVWNQMRLGSWLAGYRNRRLVHNLPHTL
jgi:hypothetical protein